MPPAPQLFPGLEKRLSNVVWKVAGGLLYVHVEWVWNLSNEIGSTSDAEPTRAGGPSGLTPPNPYLISIENLPGYGAFQVNVHQEKRANGVDAPTPAKPRPPIEDPVTTKMVAYYAYWTPSNSEPPFYYTDTKTDTSSTEVWIVDRAGFQMVYNHIITGRFTINSQEGALAEFKSLAGTTGWEGLDPDLMGVIIEQVYTFIGGVAVGAPHDPPYPPSAEGYAFWAQAEALGWAGHMETTPGGGTQKGSKGSANLIINAARAQQALTKTQRDTNRWTFDITFPEDQYAQVQAGVQAFPATKEGVPNFTPRKTFPVSPTMQRPLATDHDSEVSVGWQKAQNALIGVKANTRYRVTVQIKPLKLIAMELVSGGHGVDIVIG